MGHRHPLSGCPDDIDHYLRAAAVSHGQFLGEPNPYLDTSTPPAEKSCCDAPNPAASYWVQAGLRTVTVPSDVQPEHVSCDAAVTNPRFVCNGPPRPDNRYYTLMGTIEPFAYAIPGVALAIFGVSERLPLRPSGPRPRCLAGNGSRGRAARRPPREDAGFATPWVRNGDIRGRSVAG